MPEEKKLPNAPEGDILTAEKIEVKKPSMYRVILINDDYTPQEFVVWVLENIFLKTKQVATTIMLEAHTTGKAIIGIYTYDIARTKVLNVIELAQENEHPLECSIEPEGESGK